VRDGEVLEAGEGVGLHVHGTEHGELRTWLSQQGRVTCEGEGLEVGHAATADGGDEGGKVVVESAGREGEREPPVVVSGGTVKVLEDEENEGEAKPT
jgi:hypothetical protein